MSKRNKKIIKELQEQLQQKERQLQNMDVGFIVFIKSRIRKFLNCFKIKNLDLFKNYKITKLKIVLPSLCLLFVVGLVCFFAFAEPADQLPQNQSFLNLAHSHINASTTAPITYTSASTQTTQADFEQTGAGGFGYSATTTSGQVKPSGASPNLSDTTLYRNIFDLGAKTKAYSIALIKSVITNTDLKVFIRSGNAPIINTDSIAENTYRDTTQADFSVGAGGSGWQAMSSGELRAGPGSAGSCDDVITDTRDGKTYATVQIGTQCWMKQNMNIGTRIAGTSNQGTGCAAGTIQKYCYNNTDAYCDTTNNPNYPDGGLYQWDQAMCGSTTEGAQGICPTGWHIPTDAQQHTLDNYLADGSCNASRSGTWDCDPAGTKLKPNGSSGFEGNLAGDRYTDGSFYARDALAFFWSSLESGTNAWIRYLQSSYSTVNRAANTQLLGFSVRCIKD
ncbi:MAG: FISUMP domain-containing protein [Patescibacteria group bacterium]